MLDFFQRGGWAMWFLLTAAIVAVIFIIERIITFLILKRNPAAFTDRLHEIIETEGIEPAVEYCAESSSPIARIMEAVLIEFQYVGKDKDLLEEAIAKAGVKELAFLDRGMAPLAAVVQLAPMLGFLGTVAGMVAAFDAIALAGTVEPKLVASGISQALITTMTGLAIAIPTAAAHVLFSTIINNYTRSMEEASNSIIELLLQMEVVEE